MDLAKIRKKALLGLDAPPAALGEEPVKADIRQDPQTRADSRPFGTALRPADSLQFAFQALPLRRDTGRSPLEILLAGRADAGCGEVRESDLHEQVPSADAEIEEFLCIRVSDEIYGINIMKIKEIITPRQVTEVPRTPLFVRGVISLRGVIIPVLDMTDRLGLIRAASSGKERVVVVKSGSDSLTGLLVDQVTHVARVAAACIEPAPVTLDGIDRDFVRGIGRADNRLIIILKIESIIDFQLS